ncbi:hypothetical protein VKT23_012784 [Stygiomarasmius scandens]|uniref:Uncharacterized protein n=1 Tax=Marasmiellus scandens TaxID=2682957 RepID=A0ABR1J5P9_9AGAR
MRSELPKPSKKIVQVPYVEIQSPLKLYPSVSSNELKGPPEVCIPRPISPLSRSMSPLTPFPSSPTVNLPPASDSGTPALQADAREQAVDALDMLDVTYNDLEREELENRKKKTVKEADVQEQAVDALDMLDVTYDDLEHEERESREKRAVKEQDFSGNVDSEADDNESEWGGCTTDGLSSIGSPSKVPRLIPRADSATTPQEKAIEALCAFVTSSMNQDDITEQLEGILGKLSSVWYEAIATAVGEPEQTVEEVYQALEGYVPSLLGYTIPQLDSDASPSSPTSKEKAVEALQLYTGSSMGVEKITDNLTALLGDLSSDWHQAIALATAEPDQPVDKVLQRLEEHVPSLLGGHHSAHRRNMVNYTLPPPESGSDEDASDWGAEHEQEKALRKKRKERLQKIREKRGETVDVESNSDLEETEEELDPLVVVKRHYVRTNGRFKGRGTPTPQFKDKKVWVPVPNTNSEDGTTV